VKRIGMGCIIVILALGGMAATAEAHGWRHHHHHGHGHFFGGFLFGATTVLVIDAVTTPRVVYAYPPPPPPVYYRVPVCQDVLVPGRSELRARDNNGFTTYYHVWVPDSWQRQCH